VIVVTLVAAVALVSDQFDKRVAAQFARQRPRRRRLSRHISGVWITKRWTMPSDSVTCSAFRASSRQSGYPE
jgi:hypothetical protein